jgi:hypothetical protein
LIHFTFTPPLRVWRLKMAALALPRRTSEEWIGVVAARPKPAYEINISGKTAL